jgi:hypothetical protein
MADASNEHEDTNQPSDAINNAPSPPQTEVSRHIEQNEETVTASPEGRVDEDKDTAATLIHIPREKVRLWTLYTNSQFFPTSARVNQANRHQVLCTSI